MFLLCYLIEQEVLVIRGMARHGRLHFYLYMYYMQLSNNHNKAIEF